ncbi:hypothetical protein [Anaerobacterium chartisolvens]|nr:hypothetical protein [Anaerobacterium chartisolvens]
MNTLKLFGKLQPATAAASWGTVLLLSFQSYAALRKHKNNHDFLTQKNA